MTKHEIKVPLGIQYISEWKDYELPKGQNCIVDKGVTGCGYTEFCLTNKENVILCSPRKLLLENKRDQHSEDPNILYLENELVNFSDVRTMEDKIRDHIFFCTFKCLPIKFMVTYDSLHYISEYLRRMDRLRDFIFVVDEFQSIFLDSYFKSEVELDFLQYLKGCPNVIYLSATPMLDEYLEKLPEFKDLDFYKLDWSETGYVENIVIKRRRVSSLGSECGKIIEKYLRGEFDILLDEITGTPVESKQAVFFFNSVGDISKLLKKYGLTPENTTVICSDTAENKSKLKTLGFKIGRVPLKGEEFPMFMFCTSAIYMGIDLYSPCASSYVFADPNIKCLALDISLDLPQIVGRQRDKKNPFKNIVTLFYKTRGANSKLTKEEFDKIQHERKEMTQSLLDLYDSAKTNKEKLAFLKKIKDSIKVSKYETDFVSISEKTGQPVYNYLIEIANERAWKVSQSDYQDSISVTKSLLERGYQTSKYQSTEELRVLDFLTNKFYKTNIFSERLKLYCEFCDENLDPNTRIELNARINDPKYRTFYNFYGTSGCRAKSYKESELLRGWKDISLEDRLSVEIVARFKPGDRYPMKEIKSILSDIYEEVGLSKTAKAKDLEKYFRLSKTRITLPDKKVVDGFKLLGLS